MNEAPRKWEIEAFSPAEVQGRSKDMLELGVLRNLRGESWHIRPRWHMILTTSRLIKRHIVRVTQLAASQQT